jgi:hypothetical protein
MANGGVRPLWEIGNLHHYEMPVNEIGQKFELIFCGLMNIIVPLKDRGKMS